MSDNINTRIAEQVEICGDCGEMLDFCVCEYLPRDWDLDAEELEDPIPNEDPIGFYGEGFFDYMREDPGYGPMDGGYDEEPHAW